ncbi:HNH endonuclease signature motif containing protein [Haliscomenobacter sp.]|uniref:HNH endonuclease n=1 Tax=Haliscomenobacter sp. TaxID=2717303 RepID=UPI003364FA5F
MTESLRTSVRLRAHSCCEYCLAQETFSHDPFSVEHIIPVAKGGEDELENLAWSCLGCNFHKFTSTTAIDLVSEASVSLFNPRENSWDEHFKWNEDITIIIGLTAIGRATINRLKLNREGLVNLRSILFKAGNHPPKFSK